MFNISCLLEKSNYRRKVEWINWGKLSWSYYKANLVSEAKTTYSQDDGLSKISYWRNNNSWIANEDTKYYYLPQVPASLWYLKPHCWAKATSASLLLYKYCTIWGTQASSSLYVGTVTILLYFKTLTGFPVSKSLSTLTTFTVNNICRREENCWEGKPFVDIECMLGILPGGGITIFWFCVVTELFVHGCPNTRNKSSSLKPSKLNLPSCRNSVRVSRYSLICSDDGFY